MKEGFKKLPKGNSRFENNWTVEIEVMAKQSKKGRLKRDY